MKNKLIILIILIFNSIALSQTGWIRVTDSIPELVIMSMQFTSNNTGYAVGSYREICPGGFFRTTNAGQNWQFQNFPYYSADDVCFLNDNTGYISAWSGPPLGSFVLKTTNSGINWICIDTSMASFFRMKFYDINTGIVVSKYSTVHKTTDGGENWFAQTGVNWAEPSCIWCFDADNWLVASSWNILNKTTNGGTNWLLLNFSNIGFESRSLYFINSTTGFSSTYSGKIFKTTNQGYNWVQISTLNFYAYGNIFFVNNNTGYVCGFGGSQNIYKTTNGGYNWYPRSTVSPNYLMKYIFFTSPDSGYVGGDHGFIYRTTTGGNVFVKNISTEIPEAFFLEQNYPNPFNAVTSIKFKVTSDKLKVTSASPYPLQRGTEVVLKVYDLMGREVRTLVDEELKAGVYEVRFESGDLPSGVYFYRMETKNFISTKKLILLK